MAGADGGADDGAGGVWILLDLPYLKNKQKKLDIAR
jgi:hypothetical protein